MEPTQNRGVNAPQGARGPPPSGATLQHPPGSRGPGERPAAEKEDARASRGQRGAEEGRGGMGARGAELSRQWGFVWSLGRGSCFDPGGEIGCRRPEQGTPNLPPTSGGRERREGGPSPSHQHEARVGRRRTALREREGQDGKVGRPLSSPRRLPDSVGSRMG